MLLADVIAELLGDDIPIRIECYDRSALGPPNAPGRLIVRSPDALAYLLTAPGDLGLGRAYVSGALDFEGDLFAALALHDHLPHVRVDPHQWLNFARLAGISGLRRPPIPAEEARLHGRRHTRERDAAAVSHHYDVSNDFYEMVLGPSMTYSCAVWSKPSTTLEEAQAAKYDLVCQKLGLQPGMRLLDVGCGWGSMAIHAAQHYGVQVVGVTLSRRQAEYAIDTVKEARLDDRVDIRVQDYRDVRDGPFDAISSIGMFEHVGGAKLDEYFSCLYALLPAQGRLLNHGIAERWGPRRGIRRHGFIDRYVFPDGELHEIGSVVARIQRAGFEARHVESLREHYALTLRAWIANLESNWDEAVAVVGMPRARIWRLYMAASAMGFEENSIQVYQTLAVRSDGGMSGLPARPDWTV
jgi:cyclopropane-fatty-acyl-phospholipid synthase